jgi:hypothetical protein
MPCCSPAIDIDSSLSSRPFVITNPFPTTAPIEAQQAYLSNTVNSFDQHNTHPFNNMVNDLLEIPSAIMDYLLEDPIELN